MLKGQVELGEVGIVLYCAMLYYATLYYVILYYTYEKAQQKKHSSWGWRDEQWHD